jgi:hypothetical protein
MKTNTRPISRFCLLELNVYCNCGSKYIKLAFVNTSTNAGYVLMPSEAVARQVV